jgi:hypothetical protein
MARPEDVWPRAMIEEVGFAADSLLEGPGFEPSVPVRGAAVSGKVTAERSSSVVKPLSLLRGTEGSNPGPSSEERYRSGIVGPH